MDDHWRFCPEVMLSRDLNKIGREPCAELGYKPSRNRDGTCPWQKKELRHSQSRKASSTYGEMAKVQERGRGAWGHTYACRGSLNWILPTKGFQVALVR